jgi:multiple sugar transport system ATP-binding protein
MSVVVCKELVKRFGESLAVDHVNVEIPDGEFMVFVGPSGCGKTTTLRMIAGLESVSDGEIRIDDKVVNDVPPRSRDIAMVFQNYALYPHYKVFDNIAYPLRKQRVPREEVDRRVRETARLLHIERLLDRWPRQLSGGERQRVALGRAIVRKPRLYLMDEPLSNLDAKLRVQMRREIIRLQHLLGTTTIYVTHDQVEAMTMGHRIMVLRSGRIQQVGGPEQLYNDPANVFVAGFLGSPAMNLLPGWLESRDGGLALVTRSGTLPLPPEVSARLRSERDGGGRRQVIWGVRAEDVRLGAPAPGAAWGDASLRGAVELVEGLGADAHVSLALGGDSLVVRTPADERPAEGENVEVFINAGKIHLFDAETEQTLSEARREAVPAGLPT